MPEHQPPRGVIACIESLEKRRAWVTKRAGGTYDIREGIALGYAVGLLKAAIRLGLVRDLEASAIEHKQIHPEWIEHERTSNEADQTG
jgi:hypothetical protein